jgi:CDP-diacylglycerol---glycerol-3-phosphate 3-phosphatidyltransferase
MNLPNRLTLGRLLLTVLFVAAMSVDHVSAKFAALVIFLVATLTDYLDGHLARKYGLVTDFGKLMDPLVDKILTAAAFILLIPAGAIPAWVVIVIISREFLITGLRLLANSKGRILPAERLGKHKTAWQMITIIYFLCLLPMSGTTWSSAPWFVIAWNGIGGLLIAVTAALTVYSGFAYLWKNRDLIEEK